jgi:predicted DNA-binding transcriptional regulator AlpA
VSELLDIVHKFGEDVAVPENPESEGSRLITLKQIEQEHGVSRSALHTYRRSASFPQPVPVEGSTKIQYRADEVAAWFEANPPQQGKRTDLPAKQQGEPAVSGYRHSGMSRADYEACEQLHATANLIEARWPGAHPTLVRDLRDLVDTINEEAAQDG